MRKILRDLEKNHPRIYDLLMIVLLTTVLAIIMVVYTIFS
jgi:hypothetical protein